MIEIDISPALLHPGEPMPFSWEGTPELPDLPLAASLRIAGSVCAVKDTLEVTGRLETQLKLSCSRCLADTPFPVDEKIDEIFMPPPAEGEAYAYDRETKRISLDRMICDVLTVDIPLQVLCSDTCRGLCPVCGQNLNEGTCRCGADDHASDQNNPFAILKDLF